MDDWNCWWRHKPMSCTPQQLSQILDAPSNGENIVPIDPYNQVFDGIYISDQSVATDISLLKSLDIRHVLNAAFGADMSLNMVYISPELYSKENISFLGIEALDISSFDLHQYFEKSAQFINSSINEGGNVLVHCREGISRSATLVLSYLMIIKGLSAPEAVHKVRQKREIYPNEGFLAQLCFLSDRLNYQINS